MQFLNRILNSQQPAPFVRLSAEEARTAILALRAHIMACESAARLLNSPPTTETLRCKHLADAIALRLGK